MPYALAEARVLDMLLGGVVAQCNSTISAGTAAQTSITLRGSIGSGNADVTPSSGQIWLFVTPGAGGSANQFTNWDVFQATGGTGTSITFASRTVVAARAVGDLAFLLNTTTGPTALANVLLNGTVYIGLSNTGAQTTIAAGSDGQVLPQGTINVASTTGFPASGNIIIDTSLGPQNIAYTGTSGGTQFTGCTGGTGTMKTTDAVFAVPSSATILSSEPTSTGSYARVAVVNNAANFPASTGTYPASKSNGATISFAQSTAAWSTGATAIPIFFIADSSTLASGNVLAWGYLNTAQAVNASGITLSFASSALGPITLL